MEKVDTLVVDKTGTLTEGKPKLITAEPVGGRSAEELLRLAASLERGSEHPLAAAIMKGAEERGLASVNVEGFRSVTGKGVVGRVDGHEVLLGNRRLMEDVRVALGDLEGRAEALRREGQTGMFVVVDGQPAGLVGVADPIKATTPEALILLRESGLHIVMLTGDSRATAEAVARRLSIEDVQAEVLPERKIEIVKRLQAEGHRVAMAGDGVNDAPALAQADVGIAMGTGTDVAMQSAGITLVKGDLRGIARARRLSRATMRNIRENLLRVRLQRAGCPDRGRRPVPRVRNSAEPYLCQRRNDIQLGLRDRQRATTAARTALRGDRHDDFTDQQSVTSHAPRINLAA